MVLRANTVAQSLMVDWLSNAPWVSTNNTAIWRSHIKVNLIRLSTYYVVYTSKRPSTLVPSAFSTTKTSLQAWIPVVSLSHPPLQEKPVNGSSSPPIHDSDDYKTKDSFCESLEPTVSTEIILLCMRPSWFVQGTARKLRHANDENHQKLALRNALTASDMKCNFIVFQDNEHSFVSFFLSSHTFIL